MNASTTSARRKLEVRSSPNAWMYAVAVWTGVIAMLDAPRPATLMLVSSHPLRSYWWPLIDAESLQGTLKHIQLCTQVIIEIVTKDQDRRLDWCLGRTSPIPLVLVGMCHGRVKLHLIRQVFGIITQYSGSGCCTFENLGFWSLFCALHVKRSNNWMGQVTTCRFVAANRLPHQL